MFGTHKLETGVQVPPIAWCLLNSGKLGVRNFEYIVTSHTCDCGVMCIFFLTCDFFDNRNLLCLISVPLSVLSGSVPTGSTQPEAPPPPPNTTDNPRQNTRESPIDSLRRDLFPSQQSSANPQSPDLSSIPSSSTPR